MTSPETLSTSRSGWALLAAGVAGITVFLALMFGPAFALMVPFWLLCVWAVFWVIRLAVRYGVNDALQANRQWMSTPDRERLRG